MLRRVESENLAETWTWSAQFYIDPVAASALNCKQNLDTKTH